MAKPKGVWLRPTELGEISEATVVSTNTQEQAIESAEKTGPAKAARTRTPLLMGAFGLCCCALTAVVFLHNYAGQIPPQTAEVFPSGAAQAAEAAPAEEFLPADTLIIADIADVDTVNIDDGAVANADAAAIRDAADSGVAAAPVTEEMLPDNAVAPDSAVIASRGEQPAPSLSSRGGDNLTAKEDGASAIVVGGESYSYSRRLSMESTAYTWTGNKTATGSWPAVGTIAVDPRIIPLGSRVYVEGYGLATAADTGGAIKGNIIDVYFDTRDECIQWGRKRGLSVYILE